MKIDSHQHFWKHDPVRHSWIDGSMAAIKRDFMPHDLKPVLDDFNIDGSILVQVEQTQAENDFLIALADKHDFIKGVVGWIDLMADEIDEQLSVLSQCKKLKGFRHVLQGEPNRALMLDEKFLKGTAALKAYDFTYDLLIYPDQLQYVPEFVSKLPDQRLVIDHIAKPDIKNKKFDEWAADIGKLNAFKNLYCKVSGMVTEADWQYWKNDDFAPYLDVVFNVFGADRIMFGSDWPVCNVAGGYLKMEKLVSTYVGKLSDIEQEKFWGLNAMEFYKLIR